MQVNSKMPGCTFHLTIKSGNAYDALWVSAFSEATLEQWKNLSQATNSNMNCNLDSLKKSFVHTADSLSGIAGKIILNKYGDRKFGHYDFWALKDEDANNLNFIGYMLVVTSQY
jgi:hypothetical protein